MLDKQLDLVLKFSRGAGVKKIHNLDIIEARTFANKFVQEMALEVISSVLVKDFFVSRKDNSVLKLRKYYNDQNLNKPILLFFHGGGYALYDIETHDSVCRYFCENLNYNVVSVDYNKSPEHPYPSALEDALLSADWVFENINLLNGNKDKIFIGGDSVGGHLAVLVNQKILPQKTFCGLVLLYPVFKFGMEYDSYQKYGQNYFLDTDTMKWFEKMYYKNTMKSDSCDVSFLIKQMPQIYMAIAQYDVLYDQSIEFINDLENNGVVVHYDVFHSLPHNFALMAGKIKKARAAMDRICEHIKIMNIN